LTLTAAPRYRSFIQPLDNLAVHGAHVGQQMRVSRPRTAAAKNSVAVALARLHISARSSVSTASGSVIISISISISIAIATMTNSNVAIAALAFEIIRSIFGPRPAYGDFGFHNCNERFQRKPSQAAVL
jgi:hypothetical protein